MLSSNNYCTTNYKFHSTKCHSIQILIINFHSTKCHSIQIHFILKYTLITIIKTTFLASTVFPNHHPLHPTMMNSYWNTFLRALWTASTFLPATVKLMVLSSFLTTRPPSCPTLNENVLLKPKKLLGLTGHPIQYYLFSADGTNVVQNFGSYLFISPTSTPIPVGLDN